MLEYNKTKPELTFFTQTFSLSIADRSLYTRRIALKNVYQNRVLDMLTYVLKKFN